MKICENCGAKLDPDLEFCTECGTSLKGSEQKPPEIKEEKNIESETKKRRSPKGKKNKVLISLLVILLLGVFGTYKFFENYYNPIKKIEAMDKAYVANNQKEFVGIFNFDKDSIVNEQSFFEYMKKGEWEDNIRNEYLYYIERQADNKSLLSYTVEDLESEKFIILEPKPIFFGLYTDYELKVIPTKVRLSSSIENAEVEIESNKIKLEDPSHEAEVSLYPGIYELNAIATNDYGELKATNELNVYPTEAINHELEFPGETYSLDANHDHYAAIVFINNESTEQTIEELENIGPFPDKDKIKVHAEIKNEDKKIVKSKQLKLSEEVGSLYFEFDERSLTSEKVKETEVAEFIHSYRSSFENAVNLGDYYEVNGFIKDGSAAEKDLKSFIEKIESYHEFDFVENEVKSIDKKESYYDVLVTETLHFDNDSNDSKGYYYTMLKQDKRYHVKETEGSYEIIDVKYFKDTKEEKKIY